jgi:hypothetical protein
MKRIIPVLAILPLLGGCGSLNAVASLLPGGGDLSLLERIEETGGVVDEKVVGNAVKALPIYCRLPLGARERVRQHVNEQPNAGGVKMGIWCPGDAPLTLQ